MRCRQKRTAPTVTELLRVQKVLEADRALCCLLSPKSVQIRNRTGKLLDVAPETIAVAEALMARGVNPERARVGVVMMVAHELLRGCKRKADIIAEP